MMGALPEGFGKRIVDPTTTAVIIQDGGTIVSMNARLGYRCMALRTTQSIRVKNLNQKLVTLPLIHKSNS